MHLLRRVPLLLVFLALAGCRATLYEPTPSVDLPPRPEQLEDNLRGHVQVLAGEIGERNCFRRNNYDAAADYIEQTFKETGLAVRRQAVIVPECDRFKCGAMTVYNIEVVLPGREPGGTIVIGAHYDTKVASPHWKDSGTRPLLDQPGTPGADDNASGVAVLLELARELSKTRPRYTIRFVAFANEEPPFFQTDAMGSAVYARSLVDDGVDVRAMIAMDTIGCFHKTSSSKRPGAASLFNLPYTFDYVMMIGNLRGRRLMHRSAKLFQDHAHTPVRVLTLPRLVRGIAWSDDASFWEQGIPAFCLTDSAYLRNDRYHGVDDTPDTLDYGPMADIAWAMRFVVETLAGGSGP